LQRIAIEFRQQSRASVVAGGEYVMRIPRPIRSIALVFTLFAAGAGIGSVPANIARADDCLTAPNSTTPQGSHWYYRMDWANQRKCWYLRAPGEASQQRASRLRPDAASAAPSQSTPAPAASTPAAVAQAGDDASPVPHLKILSVKPRPAPTMSATTDEPVRASAQHGSTAPPISQAPAPQAGASPSSAQRPGPAPTATVWPDPTPAMAALAAASDDAGAASLGREADARMSAEPRSAAERAPSTTAAATRRPAAETPLEMLLPVALGLVAAGILFRLVMKLAAARRGPVIVEYAEPSWVNDEYPEPRILDDRRQDDRRQDDWRQHDRRQAELAGDQFAPEQIAQARAARSRPSAAAARSRAASAGTPGAGVDDLETTERVIMRALQRTRAQVP
jgi:hypothetical protein